MCALQNGLLLQNSLMDMPELVGSMFQYHLRCSLRDTGGMPQNSGLRLGLDVLSKGLFVRVGKPVVCGQSMVSKTCTEFDG